MNPRSTDTKKSKPESKQTVWTEEYRFEIQCNFFISAKGGLTIREFHLVFQACKFLLIPVNAIQIGEG